MAAFFIVHWCSCVGAVSGAVSLIKKARPHAE